MTHPHTAAMINRQIAIEFDKLNDFMTFESDKPKILSRIRELKDMLDVNEVQEPQPVKDPKMLFVDFITALAKR
jgi:hypothetical protein